MTLATAMQSIERQFGKGSVFLLGDPSAIVPVEVVPTGALTLDLALGVGGCPRGRIVEVYGPESAGKTTLTLHICAEAQKMGLKVAFVDAEHALDPIYAKAIGADPDQFVISQPDYGEQALNIAHELVKSGEIGVVVVDSVAALVPKAELDGEIGAVNVGGLARMMSQTMRKLAADVNRTQTLLLFTNQIREKIGVMFGSPETTPGGRALPYYASQRLDVRRQSAGSDENHNLVKVTVKKNKVAAPFREALFDIEFGKGISQSGCVVDLAVERGLIEKSGMWFTVPGVPKAVQGRANTKLLLDSEPALLDSLYRKVMDATASR
jgi:recombination protein RecA